MVFILILFHIFEIKVIGQFSNTFNFKRKGGDGLAIRGGNGDQHY